MTKPEAAFTEAPASWNTRYITPEGFTCQITIRGESGKDLLDKAGIALSFLLENGYKPEDNKRQHRSGNVQDVKLCPIHQCNMKKFEKDGRSWYSHKADDGKWCKGKEKGS
jgi:hypothetical protein